MKIWFDIVNSPHVLFFRPIIEELVVRGHETCITIRDFAQVRPLCEELRLDYVLIGKHGGKSRLKKLSNFALRVLSLVEFANKKNFDIAISCGSYFQILAAKLLRIPSITFLDYEYQPAYHFAFRFADRVVVPSVFPEEAFVRFGARPRKIRKYNGIKEQIYLSSFHPDPGFLQSIGLDNTRVIATVRPPPTQALYHSFENPLFYEALDFLDKHNEILLVALPRDSHQRDLLLKKGYTNMIILENAVDGKNLSYYSDLVISAGGTMNREAAILGTPAYSIYLGKVGAMDRCLVDMGRIISIKNSQDIKRIHVKKKDTIDPLRNTNVLKEVIEHITEI